MERKDLINDMRKYVTIQGEDVEVIFYNLQQKIPATSKSKYKINIKV